MLYTFAQKKPKKIFIGFLNKLKKKFQVKTYLKFKGYHRKNRITEKI